MDFCSLLHIRPWELDYLSVWEFYSFCDAIDNTKKAMKNG